MSADADSLHAGTSPLYDGGAEPSSALVDALGKLLVFAAVYPPEHVRVTTLAGPLAVEIARRATDDVPWTVQLDDDGVLVDGELVPTVTVASRHLRRDLELLGLCEVDFFRTLNASDLIEFANAVRTAMRRENNRRTFAEPGALALPPSIAARFSDFGTPEFGAEEEGLTWCGEVLELAETSADADAASLDEWRRLARLLAAGGLRGSWSDRGQTDGGD